MPEIRQVPGPAKQQLEMLIKGMGNLQEKVGWFESAIYPDGTPVAGVAYVQEFGSLKHNIPVRSFFRSTIVEKHRDWASFVQARARALLKGNIDAKQLSADLGTKVAGDVRRKIADITTPALAPATVKARMRRYAQYQRLKTRAARMRMAGSPPSSLTKPLVDTKVMITTLTHVTEG